MIRDPTSPVNLRPSDAAIAADKPTGVPRPLPRPAAAALPVLATRSAGAATTEGLPAVHLEGRLPVGLGVHKSIIDAAQPRTVDVPVRLRLPVGRVRLAPTVVANGAPAAGGTQANAGTAPARALSCLRASPTAPDVPADGPVLVEAKADAGPVALSATTAANVNTAPLPRRAKRPPRGAGRLRRRR